MKKRAVFLVLIPLVVLLVLALAVPGCSSGTASKDKILVGMTRPLSGPDQIVGDSAFKPIYEYFVKTWNADGGLNIGGKKMPIELKVYDNKSDIPTMTKQLEQLIVQDKVDFVWAPCSTAASFRRRSYCQQI